VVRQRGGTTWLRAFRAVVELLLVVDIFSLLVTPLEHVRSVGKVQVTVFWQGDPYMHRMHPELDPGQIAVGLSQVRDNQFIDYSALQTLLYLISHHLVFLLVTIPMLVMARRVITRAIDGDPFTPEMVRRLRILGLVVLVGGALSELTEYVCATVLLHITVPADALDFSEPDVKITLWWVMPAFILLAVSEVVRRGVAMRAELDTVI